MIIESIKPTQLQIEATKAQLRQYAETKLNRKFDDKPFQIVCHSPTELYGTCIGKTLFGWMLIDYFYIEQKYRNKGYGKEILNFCKSYTWSEQLKGIEVWTQSHESPQFYDKNGFDTVAVIPEFTEGQFRYCFRYINPFYVQK